jgi:uncharacterized protein (TIGR03083 family)
MSIDLGELYRASRTRITEMVSDDVADVPVQATPAWTVHDLVAHVTGVVTDVLAGNTDGAATDPWTAAQVERCRDRTVSEMIDEWATTAPTFEAFLSTPAGEVAARAVLDVHCHEADLCQALGLPAKAPDEFLSWVTPFLMVDFDQQVAAQGLPAVKVEAPPVEIFRGRLGRRTADEVRRFSWSADPSPYLDAWFIFGQADRSLGEMA